MVVGATFAWQFYYPCYSHQLKKIGVIKIGSHHQLNPNEIKTCMVVSATFAWQIYYPCYSHQLKKIWVIKIGSHHQLNL